MSKISRRQNSSLPPFIVPTSVQKPSGSSVKRLANPSRLEIFYSMSPEEEGLRFNAGAMKQVSSQVKIKNTNERSVYLETRYKETPPSKYNFPEATSWRYG